MGLPICEDYTGYDQILLTGGEPMLAPDLIERVISDIHKQTECPIYLYTAYVRDVPAVLRILHQLDGLTLTLHEQSDVEPWLELDKVVPWTTKSLRLNVFEGVDLSAYDTWRWDVKDHIQWIPDCPLPEGEVFMRCKESLWHSCLT